MQSCKNTCHQDCQDELQAAKACMLKEGGCDAEQCSPGFKAGDGCFGTWCSCNCVDAYHLHVRQRVWWDVRGS
jgi:hypothetical protein